MNNYILCTLMHLQYCASPALCVNNKRAVWKGAGVYGPLNMGREHGPCVPSCSANEQRRNKFNMFNLFRRCRKDEISFDIVAKNGNNVEATFDIVERIVKRVAFDNVASTLLLVWTGPKASQIFARTQYSTLQLHPILLQRAIEIHVVVD